jgi:mycothiol maleylpyruvate isomerase-like protein
VIAGLDSVRTAYGELLARTDALDETAAWRATGCAGWTARDLVFHLLTDAQRALVALGTPAAGVADVDAVSYWRPWQPGLPGAQAARRSIRIMASVWTSANALTALYGETARAVLVHAARADGAALVATQGHVLTVDDLLTTLAVEAAVHHLDLVAFCNDPGPGAQSLALVRETLDGLLGHSAPPDWDDARYAVIGTGRASPTDAERAALGADAARLPLFG